jgi:hypothetical protein
LINSLGKMIGFHFLVAVRAVIVVTPCLEPINSTNSVKEMRPVTSHRHHFFCGLKLIQTNRTLSISLVHVCVELDVQNGSQECCAD